MMKYILTALLLVLIAARFLTPEPREYQYLSTVDMDIPAFSVVNVKDGSSFTDKDLPGNAMISFISTSCGYCIEQHRLLSNMKEFPVPVYLMFMDQDEDRINAMLEKYPGSYYDSALLAGKEFISELEVRGTPMNFIIRNGKIVKIVNGMLNNDAIDTIRKEFK